MFLLIIWFYRGFSRFLSVGSLLCFYTQWVEFSGYVFDHDEMDVIVESNLVELEL